MFCAFACAVSAVHSHALSFPISDCIHAETTFSRRPPGLSLQRRGRRSTAARRANESLEAVALSRVAWKLSSVTCSHHRQIEVSG
jgi:hypothetical protein